MNLGLWLYLGSSPFSSGKLISVLVWIKNEVLIKPILVEIGNFMYRQIKPGMPLSIVFEKEFNKPDARYIKAVVYDCKENNITISQTTPALNASFLKRRVMVTFLAHKEQRVLRFGFPAHIVDLISNYEISSENKVEALLLKKLAMQEPVDFRMYYRIQPPSDTNLRIFLQEQKVGLLDVSIGGAKFCYPERNIFDLNKEISLKLIIADQIFNVDAIVRGIRDAHLTTKNTYLQCVSVEFRIADKKMETFLGRAIMDIERNLLSQGKI